MFTCSVPLQFIWCNLVSFFCFRHEGEKRKKKKERERSIGNTQWTLFTRNHNISFICLKEIMSQQEPFPGHFCLFPGQLLCREITLLLYFPAKFSREFTLSLYFPANDRKPTERLSFSTELQWKKVWLVWGLNPQPSDHMSTALSIELWSLDENSNFLSTLFKFYRIFLKKQIWNWGGG